MEIENVTTVWEKFMMFETVDANESGTIAWISMSDLFLLTTVLLTCLYSQKQPSQDPVLNEGFSILKKQYGQLLQKHVLQKSLLIHKQGKIDEQLRLIVEHNQLIPDLQSKITKHRHTIATLSKRHQENEKLIEKIAQRAHGEKVIRQELIGLKGKFKRVAFIIDRSGSMGVTSKHSKLDRWTQVRKIVEAWLQYLPVKKCVVLAFNATVELYPHNRHGQLVEMVGKKAAINRCKIIAWLKSITPIGNTNIYNAIQQAFAFDIDTIVLFTDGKPSELYAYTTKTREQLQQEILQLSCTRKIPFNIVGLGKYYTEQYGGFLIQLAEKTQGSFGGR